MLGAIVEGVPAGLALTEDDLAVDLARAPARLRPRRAPGDRARPRRILVGVRHG
jgi:chorismate synthase